MYNIIQNPTKNELIFLKSVVKNWFESQIKKGLTIDEVKEIIENNENERHELSQKAINLAHKYNVVK